MDTDAENYVKIKFLGQIVDGEFDELFVYLELSSLVEDQHEISQNF
jgi:hypothetical protein